VSRFLKGSYSTASSSPLLAQCQSWQSCRI
jgi:hypothetical protein